MLTVPFKNKYMFLVGTACLSPLVPFLAGANENPSDGEKCPPGRMATVTYNIKSLILDII